MNRDDKIIILLNIFAGVLNIIMGILQKDFFQVISGICLFIISDFIKKLCIRNTIIKNQERIVKKYIFVIDEMAKAWKQDDARSIEEIKQYFYGKVENE